MEFQSTFLANRLLIIESLAENELHTGQRLEDSLSANCRTTSFGLELKAVSHRQELLDYLADIARRARDAGLRPIVHLDMHGTRKLGLRLLPSGEYLSWPDLAKACRDIVEASDNNLIVVMAACHGFNAAVEIRIRDLTPFTYLIAPSTTVSAGQVDAAFTEFYRTLLATGDFDETWEHLPPQYNVLDCEALLLVSYARYVLENCKGKGKRQRLERLLTTFKNSAPGVDLSSNRQQLRQLIRPSKASFERFRGSFLLADRPSNHGRFAATFEHALKLVEQGRQL